MKLNEMTINKKLLAACKKVETRLKEEGYRAPMYDVKVAPVSNTEVNVHAAVNTFLSVKEELEFRQAVKEITDIASAKLDPTRIVDDSSFGGFSTFLIKRGKKIVADSLLSDIDLTFHFPVNRYK